MKLAWRAVAPDGRIVTGWHEKVTNEELARHLNGRGLTLLHARLRRMPRHRLSRRERLFFFFELEQLLRAGVPLLDALGDLCEAPRLQAMTAALMLAIEAGATFSQALSEQGFDAVTVNLIRAGEASGRLPEVLEKIVQSLHWQDELAAGIKQALTYPLFALAVIVGAVIFLLVQVVPQLVLFLQALSAPLPLPTRILIAASNLVLNFGLWFLALLIPLLALFIYLIRTRSGWALHFDRLLLRLPLVGDVLLAQLSARFAHALALLYEAGIPLLDALALCEGFAGNRALTQAIAQAASAVRSGSGLADAFAQTRLFPALVIRMLGIGERTGALDTALAHAAHYHERDVKERVAQMQALIEPCLTLVLGGLLALLMLAVLGPVFSAMGTVR
jgi:type IV pilus assembly protein PilC